MNIGDFIKQKREDKNLSIRELSRLSSVSHPYISQIETGKNDKPSHEILHKLAISIIQHVNMHQYLALTRIQFGNIISLNVEQ